MICESKQKLRESLLGEQEFTDISEEVAADPLFKVVDFLQQNWAVIIEDDKGARIIFYGDTRGVFDELRYDKLKVAKDALRRNGFRRYREDKKAQEFIGLPRGRFHLREHPRGQIYSSGEYWS